MARTSARTVLAIILTHNAPEALRSCLGSICAQTVPPTGVLVVDNASTPPASVAPDPTSSSSVPVAVMRLSDNLGPAGGHAVGLRQFLRSGWDLAWVFDDDCVPEPDCLAELLDLEAQAQRDSGIIFPTQVNRHGQVENYPAWFGVLLPREVVETVGLPMAELFWWTEDTEYLQWRIPRAGFQVRRQTNAKITHHGVRRTANKPRWKYYYESRNSVYYRVYVQRCRRLQRLGRYLARTLLKICLYEDRRPAKLASVLLGVHHGLWRHLGKTVPVDDARSGAIALEAPAPR